MDGRVVTWNKGAERIFGYSENEMVGQMLDPLYLPEEREANEPAIERQRALREGRAEDERWYLHKNGTRLYCSGVITPMSSDSFRGFAKIVRDLTQRKGTEALRTAQDLAGTLGAAEDRSGQPAQGRVPRGAVA